ncbi:hypothetical protein Vretimale_8826 [Volvox reticuliferus]|uniref:Methyltransferase small domain-containing protein n=1 Tax=Volvox reticuliferus TaxID=1737510 RepID=A0A8J4C6X0_9CHLO|nr:hypothetical protein Vretifemale_6291 [Volvox reticuliferus]GIM04211.1 hypothetical protein Vretimale_8826 [Volvox reticuliferus]
MKLKELHALMQDIAPFPWPKVDLEQYPTGPHLASRLLFAIDSSYDELAGRTVVDLGCGTAMLSIGAALLGSRHVVAVDIDPDAVEVAADNVAQFEDPLPIDFILADVRHLSHQLPRLRADVVIMNPPFGTKLKGADMAFLRAAFSVATTSVYSLHKSSTREFIAKTAKRDLGASSAEVLAMLRYDLPPTMKFHRQKSVDIEVDLWRFQVGEAAASRRNADTEVYSTAPAATPLASQVTRGSAVGGRHKTRGMGGRRHHHYDAGPYGGRQGGRSGREEREGEVEGTSDEEGEDEEEGPREEGEEQ